MHKYVNLVDLVKRFPTSRHLPKLKIGFDTAQNEHLRVWGDHGGSLTYAMRTLKLYIVTLVQEVEHDSDLLLGQFWAVA